MYRRPSWMRLELLLPTDPYKDTLRLSRGVPIEPLEVMMRLREVCDLPCKCTTS